MYVDEDGKVTNGLYHGMVFSEISTEETTRVYKCESISYAEDGLVAVAGSVAPVTSVGGKPVLELLQWGDDDFVEESF